MKNNVSGRFFIFPLILIFSFYAGRSAENIMISMTDVPDPPKIPTRVPWPPPWRSPTSVPPTASPTDNLPPFTPTPTEEFTPTPTITPTPTLTPTPRPIAQGRQKYSAFMGRTTGPKMMEFYIDPHDPILGATQSVEVKVRDTNGNPVSEVKVNLVTDNGTATYPLSLISGDNVYGVWKGSWIMDDLHEHIYLVIPEAKSASGASKATITIR